VRPGPRASAHDLGLWFATNWWRLRWEPPSNAQGWRLSHEIAGAGGGYAWPSLSIGSDGTHMLLKATASEDSVLPVRYLNDVAVQISAANFERGIDRFLDQVLARLSTSGLSGTALADLWTTVLEERGSEALAPRRRLEAMLGFDAEEGPQDLLDELAAKMETIGRSATEEMAAAEKARASGRIDEILQHLAGTGMSMRIPDEAGALHALADPRAPEELPWQRAERVARAARHHWGLENGPIANRQLADILGIPVGFIDGTRADTRSFMAAGLRTRGQDSIDIALRSRIPAGRRFELARLAADHVYAGGDDRLLPVTRAGTDRQKFQRAYAQELLLPYEELMDRLGQPEPGSAEIDDTELDEIAGEYGVSPLVARTVLVNKGILPRETLMVTT
jgi:hypothetical protein